jgi:NAD(P)-dependent dehydrogenase (short-subunit alcohol dehydrogenase family)
MKFEGKVALVTGAAHGMGRAHALALAREGATVAVADICQDVGPLFYHMGTEEELMGVVDEVKALGRRAIGIKCDVRKSSDVGAMVKKTLDAFGRIDILVSNAGILKTGLVPDIAEEEWDTILDVNLKGFFLCCKHVVPVMKQQKSGKIVAISSAAGKEGWGQLGAYGASKAGILSLVQALAKEVAEWNINVNAVCPGAVDTPMTRAGVPKGWDPAAVYKGLVQSVHLFKREVTPEDISNAVVWLASEDSRNVTGQAISVDGGMWALEPFPKM